MRIVSIPSRDELDELLYDGFDLNLIEARLSLNDLDLLMTALSGYIKIINLLDSVDDAYNHGTLDLYLELYDRIAFLPVVSGARRELLGREALLKGKLKDE